MSHHRTTPMARTTVVDLNDGSEIIFVNDLSKRQNLVTCYMMHKGLNIHDNNKRKDLVDKISCGNVSIGLGDYATML